MMKLWYWFPLGARLHVGLYLHPTAWCFRRGYWPNRDVIERLPIKVPAFRFLVLGPLQLRLWNKRWPR